MNCPNCEAHVYIGQKVCGHCGYIFSEVEVPTIHGQLKKMGLDRRREESPAEHAARCRQYLKENYILPDPVQKQIDLEEAEEALREREAIQAENNDE